MSIALNKMEPRAGGLFITQRRSFSLLGEFKIETLQKTLDFAYEMSFGKAGEHRRHRSGGTHNRRNGEIFANTFQGKLSEFAVYYQLHKEYELETPDLSTYGLGEWDDFDFIIKGKKASIKSTKSFGNLLLLETKDWNKNAEYIPNLGKGAANYELFILVRIEPYCEDLMRRIKSLYSDSQSKKNLSTIIMGEKWKYDIPGYITNDELKYAIQHDFVIKQGEMLNGKTRMDATNYYIQAGDMHSIKNMHEDC